jgi:UDP-N-acetylmuramate dehydrogenase
MVMTVSYGSPSQANWQPEGSITLLGTDCVIRSQVPLAPLTSYRVGGAAEWFIAPRSLEQLTAALEWAEGEALPITLIGGGSNLLISDLGLSGLVIGTRYLRQNHFDPQTGRLTASAGEALPRLAWTAARLGWQGLEWAVGIPGTVGGAVVMNAGAHGFCVADLLVEAHVLSKTGEMNILTPSQLGYGYRSSNLQGSSSLVTQATFQLKPGAEPTTVLAETTQQLNHRRSTQPYHLPSCGSVFRNPTPQAAGWLIEQIGLKGYQIGGAQVAERHANFIVNNGGASAQDIFQLISYVQDQVKSHWSVWLKPEVKLLGEF